MTDAAAACAGVAAASLILSRLGRDALAPELFPVLAFFTIAGLTIALLLCARHVVAALPAGSLRFPWLIALSIHAVVGAVPFVRAVQLFAGFHSGTHDLSVPLRFPVEMGLALCLTWLIATGMMTPDPDGACPPVPSALRLALLAAAHVTFLPTWVGFAGPMPEGLFRAAELSATAVYPLAGMLLTDALLD